MKIKNLNEEIQKKSPIIYVDQDDNQYIWNGRSYVQIDDAKKMDDEQQKRLAQILIDDSNLQADLKKMNSFFKGNEERLKQYLQKGKVEYNDDDLETLRTYIDTNGLVRGSRSAIRTALSDSIHEFVASLEQKRYEDTWQMPDIELPGIKTRGKIEHKEEVVPLVKLYYDNSGSWGSADIKLGNSILKELIDCSLGSDPLIKLEIRYFTSNIDHPDGYLSSTPLWDKDGDCHGGTNCARVVWNDIRQTKPDNVFIMTDDDFDGWDGKYLTPIVVPGCVWLLFRGDYAQTVIDNIEGAQGTSSFMIE